MCGRFSRVYEKYRGGNIYGIIKYFVFPVDQLLIKGLKF